MFRRNWGPGRNATETILAPTTMAFVCSEGVECEVETVKMGSSTKRWVNVVYCADGVHCGTWLPGMWRRVAAPSTWNCCAVC